MRRIWPPESEAEEAVTISDIPHLRDWCAYFEVNFGDDGSADRFVRHYGLRFPRAGGTVRGKTAWVTLRIAAADEHEAAILAALSVKMAVTVKPATATPEGALLHHVDEVQAGFADSQEKLREERQRMMRYADALGIKRQLGYEPAEAERRRLRERPQADHRGALGPGGEPPTD